MIKILPATKGDLVFLVPVARHFFDLAFSPTNPKDIMEAYMNDAFTLEKFKKEFTEPGSVILIAWSDGRIAGYARLRKNSEVDHLFESSKIELQRFYLDPEFHGSGLADQLFAACLRACEHTEWIWLGVWEFNPRAIRFYEKHGFKKFGEHIFRMGHEDQTDWLMRRRVLDALL